jgi:Atypical PilZ domain, cyclic di-GMP receptor
MYEGVDTVVLHNELACSDVLPVEWQTLTQPLNSYSLASMEEANILLLQACVAVEENPVRDKNEDLGPVANELARLDFKINLVLQLLGTLVKKHLPTEPVAVQFNALGATWEPRGVAPMMDAHGVLRIQLRGSLPQTLDLPAEVSEIDDRSVSVRFTHLSETTRDLIQKFCFLRHRKHIADSRKSREED